MRAEAGSIHNVIVRAKNKSDRICRHAIARLIYQPASRYFLLALACFVEEMINQAPLP